MSWMFDAIAARQRHEDMLHEAEQFRLAEQVARANGTETLLSRMVKLLSRSNHPSQTAGGTNGTLHPGQLADAKGR